MNMYFVAMQSELLGVSRTVSVECNNVPCAVEKAKKVLIKETRVTDWTYIWSKLVHSS